MSMRRTEDKMLLYSFEFLESVAILTRRIKLSIDTITVIVNKQKRNTNCVDAHFLKGYPDREQ